MCSEPLMKQKIHLNFFINLNNYWSISPLKDVNGAKESNEKLICDLSHGSMLTWYAISMCI